jgi:tetratricopeptide (TPR) repeat protein
MIDALVRLANLYRLHSRYEDAAPLLENALKLSQVLVGERSWQTAAHMEQYAAVLEKLGKTKEAADLRKRAKDIRLSH